MQKAVINADIVPLFCAPEWGAECVDEVLYGMTVDVLNRCGDFLCVRTEYRYEGYARAEHLYMPLSSAGSGQDALKRDGAYCAKTTADELWWDCANCMVTAPYLDILCAPNVRAPRMTGVPRGGLLCAQGAPDAQLWQCVRLVNGELGYAKARGLSPLPLRLSPNEARGTVLERTFRRNVCRTALSFLGTQYRWGGKTVLGIDCSGLASLSYWMNGVHIYRDAVLKEGFPVKPVAFEAAKPGDLLYFPGHVAIYLGGQRFVHATACAGGEGVTVAGFDAHTQRYRADLRASMLYAGSIFG